jgi:hypothetical protein
VFVCMCRYMQIGYDALSFISCSGEGICISLYEIFPNGAALSMC